MATSADFDLLATDGHARLGRIKASLNTPAVLLYTRRGFPPPLTPREVKSLYQSGASPSTFAFFMSAADFYDDPGSGVLSSFRGVREFCGLQDQKEMIVVGNKDAVNQQFGMPSSDTWVTLQTSAGQKKVANEDYIKLLSAMQPDIAVSLVDEVQMENSDKRIKKSVDRTLKWLDEYLAERKGGNVAESVTIFAAVVGGTSHRERERYARELAKREVGGYAFTGFGTGESEEEREAFVRMSLEHLDQHKPRMMSGLGSPDEILWSVKMGMDVLESAYPWFLSSQGLAISFPVSYEGIMKYADEEEMEAESSLMNGKINLWDTDYCKNTDPITKGCSCFACAKYSRAYIHHLLKTNEMLAEVFLSCHNQHCLLIFMESVRQSIADQSFEKFCTAFRKARKAPSRFLQG
uniref:Queuine tRNA-ribosyltransferase accessory subunit 2 n=1 Tax=Guillardia theta TaxID=55529 RepID=A0A7S4L0K6_GUITH|mmetsp:Transcript_35057/g.109550  ORF Transcript_35057/g.109550 Transcript_35057/m.109550 type:complete len:407 (+) Transcript_35057:261-1481(+)